MLQWYCSTVPNLMRSQNYFEPLVCARSSKYCKCFSSAEVRKMRVEWACLIKRKILSREISKGIGLGEETLTLTDLLIHYWSLPRDQVKDRALRIFVRLCQSRTHVQFEHWEVTAVIHSKVRRLSSQSAHYSHMPSNNSEAYLRLRYASCDSYTFQLTSWHVSTWKDVHQFSPPKLNSRTSILCTDYHWCCDW